MAFDLVGKAVKNLRLPTVDYNNAPITVIPAQAGDKNSRYFSVTLYDDRGDVLLSKYNGVRLVATLPNGRPEYSIGEISGDKGLCVILGSMLDESGKVECNIIFSGNDTEGKAVTLSSQTFYVLVSKTQSIGSEGSDGELSGLDQILNAIGEVAGKKTENGGEIFNDYENNQALSEFSHAEGIETTAGARAFSLPLEHTYTTSDGQDGSDGWYYLGSVEGILTALTNAVNAGKKLLYTVVLDSNFDLNGEVLDVDEANKRIKVSNYKLPLSSGSTKIDEDSYLFLVTETTSGTKKTYQYVELGDKFIGEHAHAEGRKTKAISIDTHAEGRETLALGKYAHTEGRETVATYGAHAEGKSSQALGETSHAEGLSTIALGNNSHAEGAHTLAEGNYSHAEGSNTEAKGHYSHAEGISTDAMGQASHAEGNDTHATEFYAHAEGTSTEASGQASHAEGNDTTASGNFSHTEGNNTTASKEASHAEGKRTLASGISSHAEGYGVEASGGASHAEGNGTIASKEASHAEGQGSQAAGIASHAEGGGKASGDYSHAEGKGTEATQSAAHAEGEDSKATKYFAHAEGKGTTASGSASHAEGFKTLASNDTSHAEGYEAKATGAYSHAGGYASESNHTGSFSHGMGVKSSADYQANFGKYNAPDSDALLTVGGGDDDDHRYNVLTVKKDGRVTVYKNPTDSMDVTTKKYVDSFVVDSANIKDGSVTRTKLADEVTAELNGIKETADDALSIAKGANQAKTFDTEADMNAWIDERTETTFAHDIYTGLMLPAGSTVIFSVDDVPDTEEEIEGASLTCIFSLNDVTYDLGELPVYTGNGRHFLYYVVSEQMIIESFDAHILDYNGAESRGYCTNPRWSLSLQTLDETTIPDDLLMPQATTTVDIDTCAEFYILDTGAAYWWDGSKLQSFGIQKEDLGEINAALQEIIALQEELMIPDASEVAY